MTKLIVDDLGSLLSNDYIPTKLEFCFKGKKTSVDLLIKPLPFDESDGYMQGVGEGRFNEIAPKWIAKAIIDEKGKPKFTEKEIRTKFKPALVAAMYNKLVAVSLNEIETIHESEDDKGKSE